jgi:glycosyltransferase involved in cell wall biosynthesis
MARVRNSIIVPAFNEESRIAITLDCLLQMYGDRVSKVEILVVDDGSTDRTADVVLKYRRKTYRVKLIQVPHRGKGAAVRHGVSQARGEFVFLCDADLKQGVSQLERLETALMSGADVAIGSKWAGLKVSVETQPLYRRISGRVFNLCATGLLGLRFKDTQCGLKAFTREAAQTLCEYQRIDGWGFDPELLLIAQRLGYRVTEVPIELEHDYSTSRFRPLLDGIAAFTELFGIVLRDAIGAYPRAVNTRTIISAMRPLPAKLPAAAESSQEAA